MPRLSALIASVTVIICAALSPVHAQTTHAWETYPSSAQSLFPGYAAIGRWAFNTPASYITNGPTGDNADDPRPDGLAATPVARFTSYATFAVEVGSINRSVFNIVMYDPESWTKTPANESADPTTYMASFAQLAHRFGFAVQFEPALDLARTDTVCPDIWGRNSTGYDTWYLQCGIAAAAAADSAPGDQLLVQNQPVDTNVPEYDRLFNGAYAQAGAVMPVLGEVSSNYLTTPFQAYVAARSILTNGAAGIYFTGSGRWLATVLRDLKNGGF